MRLLLDTHTAVWAISDSERIPALAQRLITDPDNQVFVSAISVLEIAIKRRLGRASAPRMSAQDAIHAFVDTGFKMLDVTAAHAIAVEDLPRRHDDPFDLLLVAQALREPMRLLTHDRTLLAYSDTVIHFD